MSDDIDEVMRSVRAGFEPSRADRERVKRRLLARAAGAGLLVSVAATTAKGSVGASPLHGALAGQSLGVLAKLFFGSMIVTFAGAGALVVASRSWPSAATRPEPPPASSAAPARARPRAEPRVGAPPGPSSSAAVDATASVSAVPSPRLPSSGAPSAKRDDGTDTSAALDAELALLREVRRADAGGRTEQAQRLLDELDRRYPHGSLLEERSALRALTDCEAAGHATARGEDFVRRYPRSVYAAKVRHVCGLSSQPAAGAVREFDITDPAAPRR